MFYLNFIATFYALVATAVTAGILSDYAANGVMWTPATLGRAMGNGIAWPVYLYRMLRGDK